MNTHKVDWTQPIEAVHEDGRVMPAKFAGDDGDRDLPISIQTEEGRYWSQRNGDISSTGWHIRNIATKPATSPVQPQGGVRVDGDVVERMEALVRAIWASGSLYYAKEVQHLYEEACSIKVALPEPVDPDLVEAREICAACFEGKPHPDFSKGENDEDPAMRIALASLRRGRALAQWEMGK